MELGLKGKNVLITGGGSNIGRAIVHAFAAEGSNITIAELAPEQGEKVAAEVVAGAARPIELGFFNVESDFLHQWLEYCHWVRCQILVVDRCDAVRAKSVVGSRDENVVLQARVDPVLALSHR